MNGYKFVTELLSRTDYDVGPLLQLTGYEETEWLEFKAASESEPDDSTPHGAPQANAWDGRWNVAKALIAMSNNIGGAVILGLDERDFSAAVDLKYSGLKKDFDDFLLNHIHANIINPASGWRTGLEGIWKCPELASKVHPYRGSYKGKPVVVFLVRPGSKDEGWIHATQEFKGKTERYVITRVAGKLGKTIKLDSEDKSLDGLEVNRYQDRPDLVNILLRFSTTYSDGGDARKHKNNYFLLTLLLVFLVSFSIFLSWLLVNRKDAGAGDANESVAGVADHLRSSRAVHYIGEYKWVCGPLGSAKEFKQGVYLNLGRQWPNQDITLVIWNMAEDQVASHLGLAGASELHGATVCGYGKIVDEKERGYGLRVSVNELKDLKLLDTPPGK